MLLYFWILWLHLSGDSFSVVLLRKKRVSDSWAISLKFLSFFWLFQKIRRLTLNHTALWLDEVQGIMRNILSFKIVDWSLRFFHSFVYVFFRLFIEVRFMFEVHQIIEVLSLLQRVVILLDLFGSKRWLLDIFSYRRVTLRLKLLKIVVFIALILRDMTVRSEVGSCWADMFKSQASREGIKIFDDAQLMRYSLSTFNLLDDVSKYKQIVVSCWKS